MNTILQYPTVQLNITLDNIQTLNYIKTLLKQMKGVRNVRVSSAPKAHMTEAEFYAKIDSSLANTQRERCCVMQPNESGEQFINRMLGV